MFCLVFIPTFFHLCTVCIICCCFLPSALGWRSFLWLLCQRLYALPRVVTSSTLYPSALFWSSVIGSLWTATCVLARLQRFIWCEIVGAKGHVSTLSLDSTWGKEKPFTGWDTLKLSTTLCTFFFFLPKLLVALRQHDGWMVSLSASQFWVPKFKSQLWPFWRL